MERRRRKWTDTLVLIIKSFFHASSIKLLYFLFLKKALFTDTRDKEVYVFFIESDMSLLLSTDATDTHSENKSKQH